MRKVSKQSNNTVPQPEKMNESLAILLVAVSVFIFLSLYSYDKMDLSFYTTNPNETPTNYIGLLGAWIGFVCINGFGLASFLLPVIILFWGIKSFFRHSWHSLLFKLLSAVVFFLSATLLLQIQQSFLLTQRKIEYGLENIGLGGLTGKIICDHFLLRLLGKEGCFIIFGGLLIASFLIFTDINIKLIVKKFLFALHWISKQIGKGLVALWKFCTEKKEKKQKLDKLPPIKKELPKIRITSQPKPMPAPTPPPAIKTRQENPEIKINVTKSKQPDKIQQLDKKFMKSISADDFKLPAVDLLSDPKGNGGDVDTRVLEKTAELLQNTLQSFSVDAQVINVSRGPVITQYELLPAPGVKIQKIETLAKDLALALKVGRVRVVAPIPGKGTVGIEVPNEKTSVVTLKELISSPEFWNPKKLLPLALGKDVSGAPIISDLASMPHLLIAGATGSGKSVCVNTIILSIIYRLSPKYARFIMIDPKMVELPAYNDIPHMVAPVITDPKKASYGLSWAVSEMERRYKLLAKIGTRNLSQYNERVEKDKTLADEEGNPYEVLPFIIIVIDELADLMLIAAAEIENNIARLAQLSRAVGIHLVLATQRPSVDVITGVIKANFPSRISFQVSSKVDSRTVLDANGADMLIGKGDMLFIPPGSSRLIRSQGAFVSDKEIRSIISFIKEQDVELIEYGEVAEKSVAKTGLNGVQGDDLLEDSIEVIKQTGQASVSILQRRLRIGYTRAARIMDLMEEQGIVGPYNGSKARDILVETYVD